MPRAPFCSRWILLAPVAVILSAWAQPAFAQHATFESPALVDASLAVVLSSSRPFHALVPPHVAAVAPLDARRFEPPRTHRPASLPALYVSFAVLQGLDAHSTLTAVRAGRSEANPALKGVVSQPAAFVGVKLAAAAGTVYLTERLWKTHRAAAVVLMVALNATYGAIVANNYRGAARRR
jgi:hypothetical protein